MTQAVEHYLSKFRDIEEKRNLKKRGRRVGSELKFPLVTASAEAASAESANALWEFLVNKGWEPLYDQVSNNLIGATLQHELNEHRASCETGFCKVEFSLAHTADLNSLEKTINEVTALMREFTKNEGVYFLGFGLQPITPPGKHLLMQKSRNAFWDRLFGGNEHIAPEDGTDVHLFTISASNQVHVDVTMDEAVKAVNVFNGLSGAQAALTANSNIWKARPDDSHMCLGERFWDWWLGDKHGDRYGTPEKKFTSLEDYFGHVLSYRPVYVRREGGVPVALPECPSFADFYDCNHTGNNGCSVTNGSCGLSADGEKTGVKSRPEDLDQHFTFFWHNARLSRYYTLENRINDQQPPEEMMTIPAFTLGLMDNLDRADSLINKYKWQDLRGLRDVALNVGLRAECGGVKALTLASEALDIANEGLIKRGLGEERFLTPLFERIKNVKSPADRAREVFINEGPEGFVKKFAV